MKTTYKVMAGSSKATRPGRSSRPSSTEDQERRADGARPDRKKATTKKKEEKADG